MIGHIDGDTRERYAYTERTLEGAVTDLGKLDVGLTLFGQQFPLNDILDTVFVPNLGEGVINIPKGHVHAEAGLPVMAMRQGETLLLGDGFAQQTPRQTDRTMAELQKWSHRSTSEAMAASFLAEMIDDLSVIEQPVSVLPAHDTIARTSSVAGGFDIARSDVEFDQAPVDRLGLVRMRPYLILSMQDKGIRLGPDVLGHEFVHVIQTTEQPLLTFGSQKRIDMHFLRDEIIAYFVGADIRMRLDGVKKFTDLTYEQIHANPQYWVESIRRKINGNQGNLDRFRPSPRFDRERVVQGLGRIVHTELDYAAMIALFDTWSPADDPREPVGQPVQVASAVAGDRL